MGDTIETILERQDEATRREQRDRRLDESYARARRLHRDREWQAVSDLFERIHAEDPNYPDPEGLLSSSRDALELERRVATLYDRGQRHIRAEELKQALECFEDVQQLEPGFRDTEEILSRLRRALAPPPRVEVPDLAGRSISQARSILANEGLKLSVYEEVPSDTMPEGEVIEQRPGPETELEAGSFVSITVSSGPPDVTEAAPPGDRAREDTNRLDRAQPPLPASTGSRWALLLRGLALGVFGLLLIGISTGSGQFQLYGTLLIVADGVFAIIDARTSVGRRRLLLLQGRIGVLVGLLMLLVLILGKTQIVSQIVPYDNAKEYVVEVIHDWQFGRRLVGSWAIFVGAIRMIAAVQLRWETKNSLLMGTGGGLLVISGSLLWLVPVFDWWRLLGFLALASGMTLIAVALRVRNA